jgi:hypothetical protein
MKRAGLLTALLLLVGSPALAQFKKVEPEPVRDVTPLECGIIKATDSDRSDPVYKINVTVTLDKGELKELWVAHTSVSGGVYVRSDQYQQASIWQTNGRTEWYWKGTRGANTMIGEVWINDAKQWWYSEKLIRNGSYLEYEMVARCHITGAE